MQPGIILTDIKMPGMDGIEVLQAIKQRDTDAEIIMMTGHGDIGLAIKSLKYGATDFITKPIDDEILEVALKRARDRMLLRQQVRNYTENLEHLVAEKSRRLVQAERMAAMGETVAGLAHAIKNITGGLKGGIFVVQKGRDLDNAKYLEQGWQMVQDNVERIEQLSLDLLNIAKPSAPKVQMTDPSAPLKQVCQLLQLQAKQFGITLRCRPAMGLALMAFEPDGIYRCLLNLAVNALDACRECGACPQDAIVELTCESFDKHGVVYKVIDNCGGMDEAVKKKAVSGLFYHQGQSGHRYRIDAKP